MKLVRFTSATPKSRRTIANGAGGLLDRVGSKPIEVTWRRVHDAIGWDVGGARVLLAGIRGLFQ